jgi:hypothetical protein
VSAVVANATGQQPEVGLIKVWAEGLGPSGITVNLVEARGRSQAKRIAIPG